jgi:hypothetical protein
MNVNHAGVSYRCTYHASVSCSTVMQGYREVLSCTCIMQMYHAGVSWVYVYAGISFTYLAGVPCRCLREVCHASVSCKRIVQV